MSSWFITVSDFRLQVLHSDLQRFVVTSLLVHVLPNIPGNPNVSFRLQKSGEGSRKTSFLSRLVELFFLLTSFLFTNKTCSALRYLSLSFEPITLRGWIWRQQVLRLQLPVTPWHLHSLLRLNRTTCYMTKEILQCLHNNIHLQKWFNKKSTTIYSKIFVLLLCLIFLHSLIFHNRMKRENLRLKHLKHLKLAASSIMVRCYVMLQTFRVKEVKIRYRGLMTGEGTVKLFGKLATNCKPFFQLHCCAGWKLFLHRFQSPTCWWIVWFPFHQIWYYRRTLPISNHHLPVAVFSCQRSHTRGFFLACTALGSRE